MQVSSNVPIAVMSLQFQDGNYNPILPVATGLPPATGTLILPQVVFGGGWYSEMTVMNPNATAISVRMDLFDNDGKPWIVNLNGTAASTFSVQVPAKGMALFTAPKQAALRSADVTAANMSQALAVLTQISAAIDQSLAAISAATAANTTTFSTAQLAQLTQFKTQLLVLQTQTNALLQQTTVLATQLQTLMTQLKNAQDDQTIAQLHDALAAISTALGPNITAINVDAAQVANIFQALQQILGPGRICTVTVLNTCIPVPVPVPVGP
jgi:hypothetical protein